ncbi:hypothetical protein [Bradyrhizobium japonicum]|uniref:hypothetical protein n=1 Tax=Bradyrhizobium japonicum TaxID=375 RepID=UPI00130DE96B|nr:hypothetical protein [Bradyrhizobium japonicum]MBR0730660.1 hypothetical protein [Bradyrhizobium japonicum]MBR0806209.1 hypothetical protein [Bradyrhizobium japonicum]MCD9111503.1 hypothetical protein [Bradyrhizobium japonicum]MCD9255499.1 hypothetical protein [Bradyrhizobium japonicum SEMIA 5079]MCD9906908.1 hypothetical protein [Bradyrhizobium japonicum]
MAWLRMMMPIKTTAMKRTEATLEMSAGARRIRDGLFPASEGMAKLFRMKMSCTWQRN